MDPNEEQITSEAVNLENESSKEKQKDPNNINENNVDNQLNEKSKDVEE